LGFGSDAVTMRVLDVDGREVHSAIKGDAKSWPLAARMTGMGDEGERTS